VAVTLSIQVVVAILCDAAIIGAVWVRLSRGQTRASTIIFSDQAIIRRIRGKLYWMFRVCELRKHQLVEAHVRCYAIRRDRDEEDGRVIHFQNFFMRLTHPNDELGGNLLMTLPSLVVHEIDQWSPLYPPPVWRARDGIVRWKSPRLIRNLLRVRRLRSELPEYDWMDEDEYNEYCGYHFPDLVQRGCDLEMERDMFHLYGSNIDSRRRVHLTWPEIRNTTQTNNIDGQSTINKCEDRDLLSPSLLDEEDEEVDKNGLRRQGKIQVIDETEDEKKGDYEEEKRKRDVEPTSGHSSSSSFYSSTSQPKKEEEVLDERGSWMRKEKRMINKYLAETNVEIVVLLEGIDALTSATLQARYSYKLSDCVWDHAFSPCVFESSEKTNSKFCSFY